MLLFLQQDLYGWNIDSDIYVGLGYSAGLTSKMIKWANGHATFESSFLNQMDLLDSAATDNVPVLYIESGSPRVDFQQDRISGITVCQRAVLNAYCVLSEKLSETHDLTENVIEGNGLTPNDCLSGCKASGLTVSTKFNRNSKWSKSRFKLRLRVLTA